MELEIINFKTDKNKYIFLDDKNIEFSFDIFYKENNYEINSIYIKYGYNIYKNNKFILKIEDKINLYNINNGIEKLKSNFSSIIPIFLPNTDNIQNFNSSKGVKIENFIEIVVEEKTSIIFKKKNNFKKIIYPNISYSNNVNSNESLLNGDIPLNVFLNASDYVSKGFFNYLLRKYLNFRLFNFFSIKIILFLVIIIIGIIVYLYSNNLETLFDFSFLLILTPLFILFLKSEFLSNLKNNIIGIRFNKRNNIIKKIEKGEFVFDDLFNEFKINYDGYYNCDFSCSLNIFFTLYIEKKFGTHKNGNGYHSYEEKITSLELCSYKGSNIDLNKIIKSDLINKVNNLNIEKLNFKPPFMNNIRILYNITYNFNSPDILNRDSEIILKNYIIK